MQAVGPRPRGDLHDTPLPMPYSALSTLVIRRNSRTPSTPKARLAALVKPPPAESFIIAPSNRSRLERIGSPLLRPSMGPGAAGTPSTPSSASRPAGGPIIRRWCAHWRRTCRSCWPSSRFLATGGGSCAPPTSSSAASWRCAAALGRWSVSSTCRAWTASCSRSLTGGTHHGKIAPSHCLRKQLDITKSGTARQGIARMVKCRG